MSFDKVTFELKAEPGFTVEREQLMAIVNASANHHKLDEIKNYLKRYDKYESFPEPHQKILDSIRNDIFDIINDE